MTLEKREAAIKWLQEEISSLRRAPEINGCGPGNWSDLLEIMETCLKAVKNHFPDLTKMVPLTLEQLREMDGEPMWVQTPGIPKYGRWVIVAGVDTEDGQRTMYCQGDYTCRNYGRDWIAYRRPPEGEA